MVIDYGMRRGFAVRIIGICGGVGVREIKCKAWDSINNKMWSCGQEGETVGEWTFQSYFNEQLGLEACIHSEDYLVSADPVPTYISDAHILKLMQYTGVNDKKGNEIYEDDILQELDTGRPFVCKWNDRIAGYKLVSTEDDKTLIGMSMARLFFEVVGNVHESGDK